MKLSIDELKELAGQFTIISTCKLMKMKKGQRPIMKFSKMNVRLGVNYKNITGVVPVSDSDQSLPWGEWKHFPYIIEHKNNEYLRCTYVKGSIPKTTYIRDGESITKDEAKSATYASEFPKNKSERKVFNIKSENIVSIG